MSKKKCIGNFKDNPINFLRKAIRYTAPFIYSMALLSACDSEPDPRYPVPYETPESDLNPVTVNSGVGGGALQPVSGSGGAAGAWVPTAGAAAAGTAGGAVPLGGAEAPNVAGAGIGGIPNGAGAGGAIGVAGTTSPPICGDGILSTGEQCEGGNTNGVTCETLGYGTGPLLCTAQCRFDVSQCQSDSGTAGTFAVGVCTPQDVETEPCGSCGERSRTCLPDGSDWGQWTECDDPCANLPPECAGQTQSPTWNSGVGDLMRSRCAACHFEANQYSSFISWRRNPLSFDRYLQPNHDFFHNLSQQESGLMMCWIALGLPEN